MNNERYNQIIDEAYEKYKIFIQTQRDLQRKEVQRLRSQGKKVKVALIELLSKEEFINKCITNTEFSKKWGLKIEEREWSVKERLFFVNKSNEEYEKALANKTQYESIGLDFELALTSRMNELNIPTKLITVTYKDEKIEVYE